MATLRELGLRMVSYDPRRSETQPLALEKEPGTPTVPQISAEDQRLMEEKRLRTSSMAAQRERIQVCAKQYEETMVTAKDVLNNLLRDPQQAVAHASTLSGQLTATFLDDQGVTIMMTASRKMDEVTHQHALNVMILTMIIGKGLGVKRDIMDAAGVGALLHDVGKANINSTILRNPQRNHSEEAVYRLHTEYGVTIVGDHVLPGVRAVIRQHHECSDGSGFPGGHKGPQINPLARMVAIANRYDNLCNPLRLSDALTPAEALSRMFAREAGRFDSAMLAIFIRELGVYPPGSFVRLSNGSIAMVIASTAGSSLKPTVLVYEPGVPRDEALVINLTESPEVKIDHVLRPAALDQNVVTYLNPRMRLSYFVQKAG